jgi:hypothetical protein
MRCHPLTTVITDEQVVLSTNSIDSKVKSGKDEVVHSRSDLPWDFWHGASITNGDYAPW